MDTDLIKERNGDFFLTKKLSLIAIFQEKKFVSSLERLCVRYSDRGSKAFRIRAKKETFFFKRDAHMLWIPEWWSKKIKNWNKRILFFRFLLVFFFSLFEKKNYKNKNLFFCRPTTVVDGSHNVSRWMTWLPISLKNAAKCDKWYQLQNLPIT